MNDAGVTTARYEPKDQSGGPGSGQGQRWPHAQDARPNPRCVPPGRPWLLGENNPYQDDPEDGIRFAMYPEPAQSAGARLCYAILGMDERAYLRAFRRRNLLARADWSVPAARAAAACLAWKFTDGDRVVLLGAKVWAAFFPREAWQPFTIRWGYGWRFLALPHPSGLCRLWNGRDPRFPAPFALARQRLRELAPELGPVLATHPGTLDWTIEEQSRRGA